MAVSIRTHSRLTDLEQELKAKLIHEWLNPNNDKGAEPNIIIDWDEKEDVATHLYVVWTKWSDLSPLQRSRIIHNAYEEVLSRQGEDPRQIIFVTLSMGFTPDEAEKMKLR